MLTKFVSIGSYSPEVRTFGTLIKSTKVFSLITRKWFPLQGELASLTKKCCILLLIITNTDSFQAGCYIVQDTFAREAVENEGGEEETTGGYFYCYFYWYFYRSG